MKSKLPKLSIGLLTLILPLILLFGPALTGTTSMDEGDEQAEQGGPTGQGSEPEQEAVEARPPDAPSGRELLQKSRQMLAKQTSIAANIRQQVELYEQRFLGTGSYRQYGNGPRKLLRLELKMQVGDNVASLLQVCDQRFLWIQKTLPTGNRLSRVDLEKLRNAGPAEGENAEGQADAAGGGTWQEGGTGFTSDTLTIGGLPALLDGLLSHFEFEPARTEEIAGEPVWVLHGYWKSESLKRLFEEGKIPAQDVRKLPLKSLPAHLPNRVQIVLGRDRLLPYFPFRIEFQRLAPTPGDGEEPGQGASPTNIQSLEFFEVHLGKPLDQRQFRFYAGEEKLIDDTAKYVARLRERAASR